MHYLVADIARTITLVPGDLLLSGTPANSRPVEPGDVVTVEVEGLGALTNRIVAGPTAIRDDVGAQPTRVGGGALDGARRRLGAPRPARATAARAPSTTDRRVARGTMSGPSARVDVEGVAGQPRPPASAGSGCASPATFEDRSPLDWSWKLADIARGDANTADAAVDRRGRRRSAAWADLGPPGGPSTCTAWPT